ncbi:protein phosphatase [Colletotrichum karsti]|uniref:Protein phosphatase n=1 Tax=Colletotrichum karsti TaxID=1095194 RepID=A0A9P6LEJ8_9PEZI|nr:protein phosphatase [Colletotrichum karsti]KAF9870493.1 protein phosphatase [Colletotrichum karsti]
MSHPTEVAIFRYMTTLYAPFSEPQAWSYIRQHMNDGVARACLVSRAMIDLLVRRIFVFEAWQGFSVDADRQIGEIRREMDNLPAGQGGALQVCIDRIAAIVNSCINHDRYEAYRNHRIEYFQAELREMLGPLLLAEDQGGPNLEEADVALRNMVEKAWAISAKMFTSRCTFDFRFPDAGARFNTQLMVAVAPNIDSHILQAEHWRVQLVVTPVITVRNDTGASISVASITKAHVICMK